MSRYNTKGFLLEMMELQKKEGACCGWIYVSGNAYKGAHYEKCANRDDCHLFAAYQTHPHQYEVADHMSRAIPHWWRRCTLFNEIKED